jgi:hypothetical protein
MPTSIQKAGDTHILEVVCLRRIEVCGDVLGQLAGLIESVHLEGLEGVDLYVSVLFLCLRQGMRP